MATVNFLESQTNPDDQWAMPGSGTGRQMPIYTMAPTGSEPDVTKTPGAPPQGSSPTMSTPESGPISYNQAMAQYHGALTGLGGAWNPDTQNDFDNLWKQSKEAGQYSGPGYGKSWNEIFNAFQPTLQARWQGGANGQAAGSSQQGITAPNQFSQNPLTSALSAFANQQAQRLQNPPEGSGQSLLEQALRSISGQFQAGGFTPHEQEVFQTQAIDPLEQLRTARKQQVNEELSRRGISPSSGVAQSMLADVDRQFDAQRATTQRNIAAQGAQEVQSRQLQAVNLLNQLAGTEQGRFDKAGQYLQVPIDLANQGFSQAMQLYNLNNPLSLIQPLLQLSQQQQSHSDNQGAALADLLYTLLNSGILR